MKLIEYVPHAGRRFYHKSISRAVGHLRRFIGREPVTTDLNDEAINRFLLHLRDETGLSTQGVENIRNALASLWNVMFDNGIVPRPAMYVISIRGLRIGRDGKPRVANNQQGAAAFARMLRGGYSPKMIDAAEQLEAHHGGSFPICLLMPSKINEYLATLSPDEAAQARGGILDLWQAAAKRNLAQPPRPDEVKLPTGQKRKRTTRELADKLLAALDE